jgi:hypothetical protein
MRLKLKEDPREWRMFTLAMGIMISIVGFLLYRREIISLSALGFIFQGLGVAILVCLIWPRFFRGFYRVGMTAGFFFGRTLSTAMLVVFFLVAVTPLGLLLRIMGKDLLHLKKPNQANSYWNPAKTSRVLDRLF